MQQHEARQGKIQLSIGNVSFTGEGDQDWLDAQITKLIQAAGSGQLESHVEDKPADPSSESPKSRAVGSLATYLKEKSAEAVQVRKFLATAGWLHLRGENPLSTRAVTTSLRQYHQKRLGNAADCLNKNVAQGYCEKDGNGFFVTEEGWQSLGEDR